jgi:hypothetical protein
VTVSAASVEIPDGIQQGGRGRMTAGQMAGVAYPRHAHLQQLRIVGAVSFVAVCAALYDGRVLPKEWTAPFGMAGQAVFVDGALDQLPWIRRSMGIVAGRTRHLTFPVGHV